MEKEKRYLQVYEQVREDIIKGRFPAGSKLPSKRVMAEAMGMSVITIEHAYELLAEEGYIVPRQKSGYFVSFDDSDIYVGADSAVNSPVSRTAYDRRYNIKETDHGAGSNEPRFSYSIYAKTVRKVLSEFDDYIMQKSPKNGMLELRSAIAGYLSRSRRLKVSPDQIVIGAGAEYLYGLIVQTFGRSMVYGVESPSYQKIAKVYEAGGATIRMLKLGKDGIESDELWNSNAKILHITPYRSFPSGVTASASKKREYLKWSRKKDGFVVEDDFESEFTPSRKPEETIFSLDDQGRVIYVNTFTRTIGSYARCAYMVLPMNLVESFTEKIGFYECPVPTLDQLVIASLIDSGDFERHINKVRRYNRNI
ncbi:MAG: PLP-dependent aminotransferase family protein [Butyrivibrio sp.]|nr:PLP-dependent aminotransferase family protein [Butyrivibrio sp.]